MRRSISFVLILLVSAILFNACKSNSTSPQPPASSGNYFPNGDGTNYKYSVTKTDSTGNTASGTRSTTFLGTTVLAGVTYQNEIDTISFGNFSASSTSLFLKTASGVEFAIDTAGLSETIPDSMKQYIQLDAALKVFQFPFQDGQSWPVFNMSLKFGAISFNLVSVTAYYQGMEPVTLNLTSGTVTDNAAKVKYVLTLTVPDLTNPLATPKTYTYTAFAWLVNNIGVVQMQGNGTIMDAFTGGGIHFSDTTATVMQSLVSYNIK